MVRLGLPTVHDNVADYNYGLRGCLKRLRQPFA